MFSHFEVMTSVTWLVSMTDSAVEFWFQVPTRVAISRHHTHTLTHHNKANQNNGGASQVALVVKNPPANAGDARDVGLILNPWCRQPTPVFLPGECHGQRSLAATDHGATESRTWLSGWAHRAVMSCHLSGLWCDPEIFWDSSGLHSLLA